MEQVWVPWSLKECRSKSGTSQGPDWLEMYRMRACGPFSLTSSSAVGLSVLHCEINPCPWCLIKCYIDPRYATFRWLWTPGSSSCSVCVHGFNGSIESLSVSFFSGPEADSMVPFYGLGAQAPLIIHSQCFLILHPSGSPPANLSQAHYLIVEEALK